MFGFNLFCDFRGYVEFFLLQDLVSPNYSSVKYHIRHSDIEEPPLPNSVNEYLEYRENSINFIKKKSRERKSPK